MYFLFPQKNNEKISVLPISLSLQIYLLKAIHWLPARLILCILRYKNYCVLWPDSCKWYKFSILHSKPLKGLENEILLSSLTALRLRFEEKVFYSKKWRYYTKKFLFLAYLMSLQYRVWHHFREPRAVQQMNIISFLSNQCLIKKSSNSNWRMM